MKDLYLSLKHGAKYSVAALMVAEQMCLEPHHLEWITEDYQSEIPVPVIAQRWGGFYFQCDMRRLCSFLPAAEGQRVARMRDWENERWRRHKEYCDWWSLVRECVLCGCAFDTGEKIEFTEQLRLTQLEESPMSRMHWKRLPIVGGIVCASATCVENVRLAVAVEPSDAKYARVKLSDISPSAVGFANAIRLRAALRVATYHARQQRLQHA
jgi:hypothetical protein